MNLPEPNLDRETAMNLWISERSDYAKEQVVLNNKGLVGNVLKSLNLDFFDDDLFMTGLVGVVKAVNKFDSERGFEFSTWATPIIRNEILHTLRKKQVISAFSLDELYKVERGDEVLFADMIADERRFEEESIANIHFENMFNSLNETEKRIISLRMDGKTQQEIGKACGISQAQASRIIKKIYQKYKTEFD